MITIVRQVNWLPLGTIALIFSMTNVKAQNPDSEASSYTETYAKTAAQANNPLANMKEKWWTNISTPIDAIVSTWALHDLGSPKNIEAVYKSCAQVLQDGGVLLNGDFIKPDKAKYKYEPGRFEIAKHISILQRVGFKNAECLLVLEEEIESPTAAQNYACFKAW